MKKLFTLFFLFPIMSFGQETQSLNFANTENSSHTAADGLIYYDINFYPDHSEFSSDGGGLSIYNGEEGWGAIFDTNNMQWLTPNFEALKISGKIELETGLSIPTSNGNTKVYNRFGQNFKSENVAFTMYGDDSTDRYSFMTDYGDSGTYTERLVIMASTGNVGVGTSSPEEKLQVNGALLMEMDSNFSNDPRILFNNDYGGANPYQTFYRWTGSASNYYATRFYDQGNNGFKIQTATSGTLGNHTFSDALTLLRNGNIGIGTSAPDSKLAVNGVIHSKEVKVDLTGWPDYVFDEDYNLPTLVEVEKYIKEKGHLINIPSAKEVEENGVELGEMNKLLLEKIEELTLYSIQQQKQLNIQNKKIIQLETSLNQLLKSTDHEN